MVRPPSLAGFCLSFGNFSVKITAPDTGDDSSSSGTTPTGNTGDGTVVNSFDPKGNVKPTDANTVADITAWLDAHNVSHSGVTAKADLLALVPSE